MFAASAEDPSPQAAIIYAQALTRSRMARFQPSCRLLL